jgi:hypothetical protein
LVLGLTDAISAEVAADTEALPFKAEVAQATSSEDATYIIDVVGERVRIVGDRFYTNPAKSLDFPGRANR